MADAEFGDALVFTEREWFLRTIHRRCRRWLYVSAFLALLYGFMLWDTDFWWPEYALILVQLALILGGVYGYHGLSLSRSGSIPGLYERGLVSVLDERVWYYDVYRIELRKDNVHVLYRTDEDGDEVEDYAFFPRKFITDEGIEKVRVQANLYR